MNARLLAIMLGAIFVLVGIVGYVPNPLVSAEGLFITNGLHNLVHIATGAMFLAAVLLKLNPRNAILVIGSAYAVVAVLGFMTSGDHLLGLVRINQADRWLHVALAVSIVLIGLISNYSPDALEQGQGEERPSSKLDQTV